MDKTFDKKTATLLREFAAQQRKIEAEPVGENEMGLKQMAAGNIAAHLENAARIVEKHMRRENELEEMAQ